MAKGCPRDYISKGVMMKDLSGGQRHLVYVLMKLASDPEVILADEILLELDLRTQARVLVMLQHMVTVRKAALLYLTVDITPVEVLCKQSMFMEKGKIIESGPTAKLLLRSEAKSVREYMRLAFQNRMAGRHVAGLHREMESALTEVKQKMISSGFS